MNVNSNSALSAPPNAVNGMNYPLIFVIAVVLSVTTHALIYSKWSPQKNEPLPVKQPEIMEVELVTPPPEVKPVEQPKPVTPTKPKAPVKPKIKPAPPKPTAPPKPVQPKAPPKVVQKTFTEAAPEVKAAKPAYTPVPVFGDPKAKPSKALESSPPATKPTSKPTAGSEGSGGVNSGVQLIHRVEPRYPMRAQSRHLEGKVTIQFTVSASGQVEDPSVASASPAGVFEEAALAAIRQFRFKPKMVNGKPVSQRSVQTINFKLSG